MHCSFSELVTVCDVDTPGVCITVKSLLICRVCAFVCQHLNQHKKPVPLLFSHSQYTFQREGTGLWRNYKGIYFSQRRKKKLSAIFVCNIWVRVLYLGLFIHIPGEGDGIVGNFFNVADCVEALLVIGCGDKQGHGLFLQSQSSQKWNFLCKNCLKSIKTAYNMLYCRILSNIRKNSFQPFYRKRNSLYTVYGRNWPINDTNMVAIVCWDKQSNGTLQFYKIKPYLPEQTNSKTSKATGGNTGNNWAQWARLRASQTTQHCPGLGP